MNRICTTIEQSQKLIELGIDTNTADMVYIDCEYLAIRDGVLEESDIPAWSLTALLKLIEAYTMQTDPIGKVFIVCEKTLYITDSYDEPLDAAFKMVCWLLENEKI